MFTVFTLGSAVVLMGLVLSYLLTTSKGRRSRAAMRRLAAQDALRPCWHHHYTAPDRADGLRRGKQADALADIARLERRTSSSAVSSRPTTPTRERSFVVNYGLTRQDYEGFRADPHCGSPGSPAPSRRKFAAWRRW
jgi:hypothetical protein